MSALYASVSNGTILSHCISISICILLSIHHTDLILLLCGKSNPSMPMLMDIDHHVDLCTDQNSKDVMPNTITHNGSKRKENTPPISFLFPLSFLSFNIILPSHPRIIRRERDTYLTIVQVRWQGPFNCAQADFPEKWNHQTKI